MAQNVWEAPSRPGVPEELEAKGEGEGGIGSSPTSADLFGEGDEVGSGTERRRSSMGSVFRNSTRDLRDVEDAITFLQAQIDPGDLARGRASKTDLQATVMLFVMDRRFEWGIAVIILLNSVYIGIETHSTMDDGDEAGIKMPWYALDLLFVVIFLIELVLRLYVERLRFFTVGWNIFDFAVVLIATIDKCIVTAVNGSVGVLGVVTVIRICRIARILRIIRLLRFCRELWLIVRGIFSAMRTLFWAWMFIALLCYIGSVFITRTVGHERLDDPDVQELFGNLGRSFFTLFQVLTVDDWVDIADTADRVAWFARPFFVLFVVCTTFAVLNVVVAVIVEKTLENSMKHSEIQIREMTKNIRKSREVVLRIFTIGDTDGDGVLTREEFLQAIRRQEVMRFLHEVGVDLRRVEQLFDILDYDESGVLDVDEFVEGVMEARGEARSKDVLELHCDLWRWEQQMNKELTEFKAETTRSSTLLSNEMRNIKDAVGRLKESIAPLL